MNNDIAKAQCEADAAWSAYCRTPSDGTWVLYVEAKKNEDALNHQANDPEEEGDEEELGEYSWGDSYIICDVCDKPILEEDYDDRHWGHEEGCPRGADVDDNDGSCMCDLEYHADCCPDCKAVPA